MYLEVEALEKRYGSFAPSVADLSFSLGQGELLGLLGPSGCGKTTTLRMISGLVQATSGTIRVGGQDVTHLPTYRRNMGVMFQSYALFPHMTIAENVAFGLQMRKVRKPDIATRVASALAMVRLDGVADRKPRELSGGQQQRVALARALVVEPDILLLDEPLSNLDAKLRDNMRNEIREIQQRLRMTTVFVTHDQTEAMAICDRIVVMNRGKLEQIGTPLDIYERPATPMVAEFVGRINRLEGQWRNDGAIAVGDSLIRANANGGTGRVLIMIRPHRIDLAAAGEPGAGSPEENMVAGTIRHITYVGDTLQYAVATAGGLLQVEKATSSATDPFQPGDSVALRWKTRDTLSFSSEATG
ncbi:spermidine/putrescine ABC transporter ATP-binding protein [Bradyrhizobium neotropicale]|uniref:Spermidine/putrescine ABC transporter ATP-binding protein n=1 Tax=Bradyrhizobium neotropicale TaxID=1497615 RepID=A0A176YJZ1_9BRAD|nr:spermidine/putrescine ABC transporter ATP-binding protein [Bradyrhizobium neotropicale]